MRERSVENYLVRKVKAAGGEVRKLVTPGRRHAPDRLVLWRGFHGIAYVEARVHFVELKKPGEKPRAGQEREHQRLRDMGFSVFVLDTKAKVDRYIQEES